jgi:hypothetical protein
MAQTTRDRLVRGFPAIGLAILVSSSTALAQPAAHSRYGGRLGFSTDPDQFTVGAYAGFPEFRPGFRARPSVDLGFGDSTLSFLVNGDAEYSFRNAEFAALPFAGAGLALAHYRVDVPGAVDDATDTEIGLNLYGGLEFDLGGYYSAMVELRFGIHRLPDVKLTGSIGFF